MEQNGNRPKDVGSKLKMMADVRRTNDVETVAAKREGRVPNLINAFLDPSAAYVMTSPPIEKVESIDSPGPGIREDAPPLMTSAEAANFLGLSVKGLRNLTSSGKVPHYKLFGHNRFKKDELTGLLKKVPVKG